MSRKYRAAAKLLLSTCVALAVVAVEPTLAEPQAGQSVSTHKRGGGADALYGQRGGEFTGTFAEVWNPFINKNVTSYSVGTYVDHGTGQRYEGEFSFVPARANGAISGYYLFQGARIDDEVDEVIQGLFISDQSFPNVGIRFRRARPDYLIKLQEEFESSQVQAAADAADAERKNRSRENMSSLINVMGGLLSIVGGGNLSSLRSSSLSALATGLTGKGSSSDILQGVVSQIVSKSAVDPSLSKALGGTSDASSVILNLTGLNKANQPMTKAQYAIYMASKLVSKEAPAGEQTITIVPVK